MDIRKFSKILGIAVIMGLVLHGCGGKQGQDQATQEQPNGEESMGPEEMEEEQPSETEGPEEPVQEQETAVYENGKQGYTIAYPTSWGMTELQYSEVKDAVSTIIINSPHFGDPNELATYQFTPKISVIVFGSEKSVEEFINDSHYKMIEEYNSDSLKFTKVEIPALTKSIGFLLKKNNKIYEIDFLSFPPHSDNNSYNQEIKRTFYKILDSFQWL